MLKIFNRFEDSRLVINKFQVWQEQAKYLIKVVRGLVLDELHYPFLTVQVRGFRIEIHEQVNYELILILDFFKEDIFKLTDTLVQVLLVKHHKVLEEHIVLCF